MSKGPSIIPGAWHSTCEYESSSRGETLTDERDVTLGVVSTWVWVTSLPGSPSLLGVELTAKGRVLTGTWTEETDLDGYYKGVKFRGAVQFIVSEDGQSMTGRWVGHSRDLAGVNTGTWTLIFAGDAK